MKDFPKKYNYSIVEKEIQEKNKKSIEHPNSKKNSYIFSGLMPISDQLHLGHIFSLFYHDATTKYLNILGADFYWNVGFYASPLSKTWNSINLKNTIQKKIINKQKTNHKQIYYSGIDTVKPLISTLNEDYMNMVRDIFMDLYKKGIIYEDKKIVYWSNEYQSVIGDDDVDFKSIKGKKYSIRYFIETKNDSVVISTTSPETIFSDAAFLVHPNDKRYKKFIGSNVLIPIINKPIPIIGDDTVDTMANNGIMRVNPNHDFDGLTLAQKHKLQIQIGSIDDKCCFTELAGIFSGKKVEDFFDNIIQYLDDISNLENISNFEYKIPVFKKTGEKLQTLLKKQRFIKVSPEDKENIQTSIYQKCPNILPVEHIENIINGLNHTDVRCISRQYSLGQQIPVRENTRGRTYIFDEQDIINDLIKSRKSRKVMLTLIVFNLILDGRLSLEFSIEELVDVLFSNVFNTETPIIDYYTQILQEKLSSNPKAKKYLKETKEFKKLTEIINMTRKGSFEKIQLLLDILKKSYLIDSQSKDYKFNINELCQDRYKISLQKCVFDVSFISSLRSTFFSGSYKNTDQKNIKGFLSTGTDNIDWIIKSLLINKYLPSKINFEQILIHQSLLNDKLNKISQSDNILLDTKDILKNYGRDCLRLSFVINGKDIDYQYCVDNLKHSDRFLNKLRNASRFIFQNFYNPRKKINISNIRKEIEKNSDKLHEIDVWLIHTFKELLNDLGPNIYQGQIIGFGKKTLNIVRRYFCDRYLEIIKYNKTDYTPNITIFHLIMILKIIHPYSPHISQKIIDHFGLDINDIKIQDFNLDTNKINKNYKIHLLFDIMDKIVAIRETNCLKQHESIDIFLQANTDFIELVEHYKDLFKKLLRINDIQYIRPQQVLPNGYIIDNVINITIGVKTKKICSEKDILNQLKLQLNEKEYHLQNLRSILSSFSVIGNKEEKIKKEKEMKKIKKEILELEYNINKIKINK